jgi:thioesterase domain-containing protein/acyl carrier protein
VPGAVLVSMGGATEASIWSNYFVVKQVDPAWRSIPYGWPLSNQSFHVLDDALRPVPTWAVGHLYIGGIGLAQGYYRDAERTAKSFITHPQTGERLYRTGDLGRYHPSGHLEFLGRSDSQVKVHGHRIELGEIDAALERCRGLRGGAAVVRSVGQHDRQLLAFYVRDPGAALGQGAVMEAAIRQHLAATLPHYMVPGLLVELDQMPVTANGKVDRNALQARAAAVQVARATKVTPRNQAEATLSALWQDLLGVAEPGVHEDFFELGGSSLMAVRLLNAIEAAFGQTLPLASLLRHGSIAKQAELLQARHHGRADDEGKAQAAQVREAVVPIRLAHDGQVQHRLLVVVHPVGGNVLCYRPLLGHVPADVDVIGIQSRGDGAARTLPEMASSYVQALLPYFDTTRQLYLLGWSMGGVLAQEMARQLEQAGVSIAALTMVDSWTGAPGSTSADVLQGFPLLKSFVGDLLQDEGLPADFEELALLPASHWPAALKAVLSDTSVGTLSTADFSKLIAEHEANFNALIQHQVKPTRIKPRQYHASRHGGFPFLAPFSMPEAAFVAGTPGPDLQVYLNETHFSIFQGDCLRHIAASTFNQGAKA